MDSAGEQAGLVQLRPTNRLNESFPAQSQEAYIDALRKEMALTGNRVTPQSYDDHVTDSANRIVEIAHQVAQRNAAKPVELGGLGLHADNTAMERAKALGFEHQTYHGTDTPDIQAFDPSKTKMWNAIFSSTNPKEASDFSRLAISKERAKQMGHESSPNVMPLMLRNTDYATPEHLTHQGLEATSLHVFYLAAFGLGDVRVGNVICATVTNC